MIGTIALGITILSYQLAKTNVQYYEYGGYTMLVTFVALLIMFPLYHWQKNAKIEEKPRNTIVTVVSVFIGSLVLLVVANILLYLYAPNYQISTDGFIKYIAICLIGLGGWGFISTIIQYKKGYALGPKNAEDFSNLLLFTFSPLIERMHSRQKDPAMFMSCVAFNLLRCIAIITAGAILFWL